MARRRAISRGRAAQAPGNSEEPAPSQVGWNMPIAQVPDLFTEGNSGEAEALQQSFLSPPALFSGLAGSVSVTGFHPVIISTGPRRTSQASLVIFKSPVKVMKNRSTTGAILHNAPNSKALLQESCTTGAGSGRGGAGCPCKRAGRQRARSHQWAEGKG